MRFLLWNLDQARAICFGHAAWHLLNAVAAGLIFLRAGENLPAPVAAATVRQ